MIMNANYYQTVVYTPLLVQPHEYYCATEAPVAGV